MTWTSEDIRHLRYRLGWCQAEMAHRLKLNVETVSSWEGGKVLPNSEHCAALLMILNQAESNAEKIIRKPLAESAMRDRGLCQIHDLDIDIFVSGGKRGS